MALDRTSGFDMLVQISEAELNNQLATLFLTGGGFPTTLSIPISMGAVVGTATLNFGTPTADLDRPRPQMGLTLPFTNSQLQVTAPLAAMFAPLGGTITIVDAIEIMTQGTNQIATMDFNNGAPNVTVVFDVPSQGILAPALAAAGLTLEQAQNVMAGFVIQQLQSSMGRLDLTPPIPVVDDADPTTVFDIDVTTVNDTSVADRDCLTFGVRMANDSGGNINGVTTSFIPAGSQSLVMMSNFWLLARVMRPRVAAALGLNVTDFDTPLRLNHNVTAPGGQGTLTNLEARVEGNRIRVDGRATDSGSGWSAESNFTFFIDITLSGGAINVVATTPTVDTDVDLAWWVWVLSLGLGALFGGIIGAIIAAIVLAIVEAVAEGIVNNLVAGGIGGALGGIPAIPLGPIGGGLTLNTIILDDLELRCSIIRSVSVPTKNTGSYGSMAAFAIDLDTGIVHSGAFAAADLVWNGNSSLSTNGPAGLTITGTSFGALMPVQISRLSLSSHNISASLIPLAAPPTVPFFSHSAVVFGVRTAEGRLAKVRAWRNIFALGQLELQWVTYDTPIPQLDIAGRWSVVERGPSTQYITPDCRYCTSRPVRRIGHFEAWPRLVAFPIDYEFCLCGTVLVEGEGTVSTANGPLDYKLEGRRLTIETDMGQNVDCELCISAIDARGQELFTCTQLSQRGIESRCRRCVPTSVHTRTDIMPARAALNGWRPLITAGNDKTSKVG